MAITPIVHPLYFLRIPTPLLSRLDSRAVHYILQPWHYLIRAAHIFASSLFFGMVAFLDMRLMGFSRSLGMRPLAENVLPWLYWTFGVSIVSGLMLFFYDPVHVGSHGYFTPKLIFLMLGMLNTLVYRRYFFGAAFRASGVMPGSAKAAGTLSLLFWFGVMFCAMLNTEAAPKVLLHYY